MDPLRRSAFALQSPLSPLPARLSESPATAPAVAPPADGGDFTEEKSDERNETVAPLAPSTELREGLAPAVAELSTDSAGPTGLLLASLDLRTRNSV